MKKNLRALVLTLGILAATGLSSTVYAKDCNTLNYTVNSGESLQQIQQICAKYGVEVPKCFSVKSQATNPTKATPCDTADCKTADCMEDCKTANCKTADCKTADCKTADCKTAPVKAADCKKMPVKAADCKATPAKVTPAKAAPAKATPAKATPAKATPAKAAPAKAAPAKVTPAKAAPATNLTENDKLVKEVVTLVNQERAKVGLAPLKENLQLSNVAKLKSEDMANKNYFSHTSPTYGSPFDMMKKFGITYSAAGENIAMGQQTAASVMSAWMNSPGHKANILSANFTEIGVGIAKNADGSIYWTQQFIGK